jgi:hypothetical protein
MPDPTDAVQVYMGVRRALSDAGHVNEAEIDEIGLTAAVRKAITDTYVRGRKHVAEGVGERLREIANSIAPYGYEDLHDLADELDPRGAEQRDNLDA